MRHSAATLLLNAGALLASIQALLGRENMETAPISARAMAGAYYLAIAQLEAQLALVDTSSLPRGASATIECL